MSETDRPLTPANQNPWYVLMTLYGEQEGEIDWNLNTMNRAAWNAWAGQAMTAEERDETAKSSKVTVEELSAWPKLSQDIEAQHERAWKARNHGGPNWPGLPAHDLDVDFRSTFFARKLLAHGFVFSRLANFFATTFGAGVRFDSAVFLEEAWFLSSAFGGIASFNSANFHSVAWFNSATFGAEAWFDSATFNGEVLFDRASFVGLTYFADASFGETAGDQTIDFRDTHFAKPTNFRDARFRATYPDFQGAVLHPETTFTAKAGDDKGPFWPQSPTDPIAAKDSCAKIRNNLGKQGFPEDEHFFYRREMRFAGLATSNPVERGAYALFGLLSDYGYSFVRPVVALAALFALGLAAYWGAFLQFGIERPLGTAIGLSFSNLFPYFGFGRFFDPQFAASLPPVLKALGGFQTVFGAVLLFLMALGLRTRFRMR